MEATRKSHSTLCDWTPGPDNEIWINSFFKRKLTMLSQDTKFERRYLDCFTPFKVTGRVHPSMGRQSIAGPYRSKCGFGKTDRARFLCTGGRTENPPLLSPAYQQDELPKTLSKALGQFLLCKPTRAHIPENNNFNNNVITYHPEFM